MPKRYYRPELDALRFFAFASVFCHHLPINAPWFQPIKEAGAFGVCMFFMLSAYLIITILLREKETAGTVNLSAFFIRRILRIWPLYFLGLFAGYALGHYFGGTAYVSGHALLAFSFLLGNLYILHHGWLGPIGPLWSISVEEQFYLAVPAIVRLGGRRGIILIGITAISVSYIVLFWLGLHANHANFDWINWVNSFIQFQFFAAGGLLALWLYPLNLAWSLPIRAALAIVGFAIWLFCDVLMKMHSLAAPLQNVSIYFCILIGTLLIFLSIIDINLPIPRPLAYLGKITYGLYVFHEFFIWLFFETADHWPRMSYFVHHKFTGILLSLGMTIATAVLSYQFFERPILKFKERFETVRTRPA